MAQSRCVEKLRKNNKICKMLGGTSVFSDVVLIEVCQQRAFVGCLMLATVIPNFLRLSKRIMQVTACLKGGLLPQMLYLPWRDAWADSPSQPTFRQ